MTHTGRPGTDTSDEYATPQNIWRPLSRAVGGFDLDPASGAEGTPIAETRYTKGDDGLAQEWFGSVWLNPPFGDRAGTGTSQRERWLQKARSEVNREAVDQIVMLLPVDTSTGWFHTHVVAAEVVCFLSTRPQFQGEDGNPGFACMILVYGDVNDDLLETLDTMGAVFRGRSHWSRSVQATLR